MRIPREEQRASGELRRKQSQLTATMGHLPSTGELAAALSIDEERVERALRVELARESVPLPRDDESQRDLGDGDEQGSDDRLSIANCMRALDERERKIVFLRFHADMTERQIASELHISQAQVSRLLGGALRRLRAELTGPDDDRSAPDSTTDNVISPDFSDVTRPEEARERDRSHASDDRAADRIASVSPSRMSFTAAAAETTFPFSSLLRNGSAGWSITGSSALVVGRAEVGRRRLRLFRSSKRRRDDRRRRFQASDFVRVSVAK